MWHVDVYFNQDFNPKRLVCGTVETELGEFIEAVYYDKVRLEPDFDDCDSMGKGFEARAGWLTVQDRDHVVNEMDPEFWLEYDEH